MTIKWFDDFEGKYYDVSGANGDVLQFSTTSGWITASVPAGDVNWGDIKGTLANQTDLKAEFDNKVTKNTAITGATKTKITYDSKGLVTSGSDLSASDLPSGIDAAKINSGAVSNTEFNYLDGVTSSIQTQLNARQEGGSVFLNSDFSTSNTSAQNTGLKFSIGASEKYEIVITGTCAKATSNTGLRVGIAAPTGCTIKGVLYRGGAALSTSLTNELITAINTLSSQFATGIGVEVPFRIEAVVQNSTTAGVIELQLATNTSNTATIYATTKLNYTKTSGL